MSEIQLYRKYSFTVHVNGGIHGSILHTQADLIREMLAATQNGAEVSIKEVWLEDQGVGPTEGDPRSEQQTP